MTQAKNFINGKNVVQIVIDASKSDFWEVELFTRELPIFCAFTDRMAKFTLFITVSVMRLLHLDKTRTERQKPQPTQSSLIFETKYSE